MGVLLCDILFGNVLAYACVGPMGTLVRRMALKQEGLASIPSFTACVMVNRSMAILIHNVNICRFVMTVRAVCYAYGDYVTLEYAMERSGSLCSLVKVR